MRFLFLALLVAVAGCDTVDSSYDTLAQARADELFGRGWLPDILPASATDIRVSNNLDLNDSTGDFRFSPADSAQFYARLTRGAPSSNHFSNWQETIEDYANDGYTAWTYRETGDDGFTWTFFCHTKKGRCEYFAW